MGINLSPQSDAVKILGVRADDEFKNGEKLREIHQGWVTRKEVP